MSSSTQQLGVGIGSSSFKQQHKKITSHTISIAGKQEISLTKSHGVGGRSSLLPGQNSLSKVAGVNHLSEKSHNVIGGNLLYLQKSQNIGGQASQNNNNRIKRDSTKNVGVNGNDYYTVQNTRNASIQNSSQQTSRNQNHLASHQVNHVISLNANDQEVSTPIMNQNRSMRSPQRSGQSSKPLDKIVENPNTSQTLSDFSKVYSQSQVKANNTSGIGNKTGTINRHSVLTGGDKAYPRATSVVKNNGLLLQKNFSQMSNFSKSQNAKKLGQITINSNLPITNYNGIDISTTSNQYGVNGSSSHNISKQSHKKSVIVQPKDQYSPKPGSEFNKNSLFKSPQMIKKNTNDGIKNSSQAPSVFISSSNSPIPLPPSSTNHQKITQRINSLNENSKQSTTSTTNINAQTRIVSSKLNKHSTASSINNLQHSSTTIVSTQNNKQLASSSINNINLNANSSSTKNNFNINGTPSCLQIDLSNLSVKPEDEPIQVYLTSNQNQSQQLINGTKSQLSNNTKTQNGQGLIQGQLSINQSNQRKQQSLSQNKKHTQQTAVSQSPSLSKNNLNGSSQIVGKSPTTQKGSQLLSNPRHSIITGTSKQKNDTAKFLDPVFQSQKSNTQKIANKTLKNQTVVKSQIPFDKSKKTSDKINAIDENEDTSKNSIFEIKNVIVSSKVKTSQSYQRSSIVEKSNIDQKSAKLSQLQEKVLDDDNFSFNSQNNKSILDSQILLQKLDDKPLKLSDLDVVVQAGVISLDQAQLQDDTILAVSEEQSNLRSHRSVALLQAVQSNKSLGVNSLENKLNTARNMSKVGSQPKITLNLDDSQDLKQLHSPSKLKFLENYEAILFEYEKKEIQELKEPRIYYEGLLIKDRTNEDLETSRMLQTEEEMLKSLDDEEGYYNVVLNDHLNYRYEILKILGKGSFAQVVCCYDHKLQQKVAIKITRNTEIDHKFASSESKLLNFLMSNDPNDSHNVVRLTNEFYFRDHHCFVFELLHSDLFEHLKENGFIGFEVSKIRDYAIQILEALMFLEKHQIIHCDLKPENILLRDEECSKLKLVDYGSGCFRNEQVYTYVQSRFYRAPEVILRIPYSEKVDIWSFGCILAELYTGEPLFPGNNEQEQLELIMEICGIPTEKVIDQSRKKEHYFDVDYSPFLIEDEEMGILRIPESRKLEEAVPCQDDNFLDFMRKCLELDPELRFSASQALQHQWIKDGILQRRDSQVSLQLVNKSIQSHSQHHKQESSTNLAAAVPNVMTRRREDEQDGVKGTIYEESPVRPIKEKPKKSLTKHFNFQTVKVGGINDNDSIISTPKNEGGIPKGDESNSSRINNHTSIIDSNFQLIVSKEKIINEEELSKPHNASMINKNINQNNNQQNIINNITNAPTVVVQDKDKQKAVKIIGKYEIVRQDDEQKQSGADTNSQTSGIATEANIPPVNQHEANIIYNENSINKITVTFYQKRANNNKSQSHNAQNIAQSKNSKKTTNSIQLDSSSKSQQLKSTKKP